MPIVEKNDVNVSRLFDWSKEVVIEGVDKKKISVYLRLLGDADVNRVRVLSLRRSAELRRALRDYNSDERLAYIPYKEELGKEGMVNAILMFSMRDITKQAVKDVVVAKPKEPGSEASTERLEKFQKEVDEYPAKRDKAIRDLMDKLLEKRKEELNSKSEDDLYNEYVTYLINELCERELMDRFRDYSVYFGAFSDKRFSKKFFNSFDVYDNLPRDIKDKLIEAYSQIDIEPNELKK